MSKDEKKKPVVPDAAQLANFDWLLRRLFTNDRTPPPGAPPVTKGETQEENQGAGLADEDGQ